MDTLYYSPGSASMAPHGVIEESSAPYTLARVDMAAMLYSSMDPPMQMEARYPNVARCAGLVAARPAIGRVLQQNQAA
jgi:hypothetical protein